MGWRPKVKMFSSISHVQSSVKPDLQIIKCGSDFRKGQSLRSAKPCLSPHRSENCHVAELLMELKVLSFCSFHRTLALFWTGSSVLLFPLSFILPFLSLFFFSFPFFSSPSLQECLTPLLFLGMGLPIVPIAQHLWDTELHTSQ